MSLLSRPKGLLKIHRVERDVENEPREHRNAGAGPPRCFCSNVTRGSSLRRTATMLRASSLS